MGPNTSFAFQHDARLGSNNVMTMFDDGAGPPVVHKQSRGLTLRLDTTRMTATLVRQDEHDPPLLAAYEGSNQLLPNGDDFIGWGAQPYFTEFNSRGQTLFDARFVGANQTYRAYRFRWTGSPATPPAVATRVKGTTTTVYASWNGATDLAKWTVLGGSDPNSLKVITTTRKQAFESVIRIPSSQHYVAVQALDGQGRVLATSTTVEVP
jgi:hypothetical protein